jgi:hypothetical protein
MLYNKKARAHKNFWNACMYLSRPKKWRLSKDKEASIINHTPSKPVSYSITLTYKNNKN